MAAKSRLNTDRLVRIGMLVLLGTHAALLLHSLRLHSVTIDESAHVPSGLVHWHTGTYGAYRVNPPLPRMLATLPLLLTDCQWVDELPASYQDPLGRVEWKSNQTFLQFNRERYHDWIFLARLAGIAWSCLGGWLVFRWACDLYGGRGGLLALAVWCFEPNMLAYAALVTPDMPCTVAGLLAMYVFRHYLRSPHWTAAALSGLALGLALLTKFTLLGLIPVMLLLAVVAPRRPADVGPGRFAVMRFGHAGVCLLASLIVVNLGYLFEGSFRRLDRIPFISRTFAGTDAVLEPATGTSEAGNRLRGTWLGRLPSPVPEDWLRGIDVQRRDFEVMQHKRPSYLAGEWRSRGWWYYYLYALGVKLPVGVIVLVLAGLGLALIRHKSSVAWRDELVLYLPALAIIGLVSSQNGFNHHMRYVIPALPFLFIGAGKLAFFLQRVRWIVGGFVLALALWACGRSLRHYPHSLSYFNEVAGGPENGHAHLVDSNIDWGQDLFFFKKWLDEHPEARPIKTALFNSRTLQADVLGFEPEYPPSGL